MSESPSRAPAANGARATECAPARAPRTPPDPATHRGYFWIGVYRPKHAVNLGTLLRSADAFGAAGVFTIGRRYSPEPGDVRASWATIPTMNFPDVAGLRMALPYSCPLVGVELRPEAVPIRDFAHPPRACYLLGAEDNGLSREAVEACHKLIVLPGTFCLNVAVAGSIVMFDRHQKAGS